MKAIVYDKKYPGQLVYRDVNKPEPGENEALIKIVAASVNAADYRSKKMGIIPKGKIFGADISGRVESVGKNVGQFKAGDEVIGELSGCGFGGFAEYVAAPENVLVHKPANLLFEEAAALPLAALTALQALHKGRIQKVYRVLIVGSGGGVGTFAVQLARYFGAEVTAVCSTKNVEQTLALGAKRVVDYTREDFTKTGGGYNLIVAVNGNRPLTAYQRMLARNGICVMVGGALIQIFESLLFGRLMSLGSKKMMSLAAKTNTKDLEFIVKLAAEGNLKPVIDRRYPLEKTPDAMVYANEGHARGKVVINVE